MEKKEQSLIRQPQSLKLKRQLHEKTADLYQTLQKCLDYSDFQNFTHPASIPSSSIPFLNSIHNNLRFQLQLLAVQQSCYNKSLISLSQSLIKQQIGYDQSNEMHVLLKKYEQRIAPLRSQMVEKQNQLYYVNKYYFQCFEDEYENCTPSRERLSTIQTEFEGRQNMLRECVEKGREKLDYQLEQKMLKKMKENDRSISFQQVKNNKIHELYANIKQVLEEQEQFQQEICQAGCLTNITNNKGVLVKQTKMLELGSGKNNLKLNIKSIPHYFFQQESTSTSFKNTQPYPKINNSRKISLNSSKKVPNFSEMPKHDYQLFRIYHKKIERQEERYQRLIQQYINYLQVYKVVRKENKQILQRVEEKQDENFFQNSVFSDELIQDIQNKLQSKIDQYKSQFDNYLTVADENEHQNQRSPRSKAQQFPSFTPARDPKQPQNPPIACVPTQTNINTEQLKNIQAQASKQTKFQSECKYFNQQTEACY